MTIFLFIFALLAQNGHGIQVSGLYQAAVPVADETVSKRNPAIKQALIQVLVKLTGDRNIRGSSDIAPLIERPERFVPTISLSTGRGSGRTECSVYRTIGSI